ncbi:MAG: CBS domain-containing protein, partial [Myxococcales bacterium]|nr:CBS domain-containing protein [Myxococcales bacterium]
SERAGDAMNEDLVTIHQDESVDAAIERIGRGDIHALVVIDDDDRLAGIVTHNDLLHYLID